MHNRSRAFGIWSVEFPRLNVLPINNTAENDFLAIPRFHGVAIQDPFHHPSQGLSVGGDPGLWNPGRCTMQFAAFYERDQPGLYLACYDGEGYRRSFTFRRSDDMRSVRYGVTDNDNELPRGSSPFPRPRYSSPVIVQRPSVLSPFVVVVAIVVVVDTLPSLGSRP